MTITHAERQWLDQLTRQTLRDIEGQPLPLPEPLSDRARYMAELMKMQRPVEFNPRIPSTDEAAEMLQRYLHQRRREILRLAPKAPWLEP